MDIKVFQQWIEGGNLSIPVVLMENYRRLGITEETLVILLQLYSFIEKGKFFPTPGEIAQRMTITEQKCTDILRRCLQLGLIEIKEQQDDELKYAEFYSLQPLWHKLVKLLEHDEIEKRNQEININEDELYNIFEREFGRPLSPIECETLTIWLDQDNHQADLIVTALKEAVLSGKLNFKYIDRILFEWNKNGVQTVEEARSYGEKFRRYQRQTKKYETKKETRSDDNTPLFNWLEG